MKSHRRAREARGLVLAWGALGVAGCDGAAAEATPARESIEVPKLPRAAMTTQPSTPLAPSPKPSAASATSSHCDQICARTSELGCALAAQCAELCLEAMQHGGCEPEMAAVARCVLSEPVSHWECTPPGLASIKQGFCDSEQQAFVHCVTR